MLYSVSTTVLNCFTADHVTPRCQTSTLSSLRKIAQVKRELQVTIILSV